MLDSTEKIVIIKIYLQFVDYSLVSSKPDLYEINILLLCVFYLLDKEKLQPISVKNDHRVYIKLQYLQQKTTTYGNNAYMHACNKA